MGRSKYKGHFCGYKVVDYKSSNWLSDKEHKGLYWKFFYRNETAHLRIENQILQKYAKNYLDSRQNKLPFTIPLPLYVIFPFGKSTVFFVLLYRMMREQKAG